MSKSIKHGTFRKQQTHCYKFTVVWGARKGLGDWVKNLCVLECKEGLLVLCWRMGAIERA